ncbi:hypothetical protein CROQUDRAFT_651185 [Cronartium quercuum f. sp. fusiforme G11]|uniref:Trafficking protein particle complex subunit 6B n=1 Tax=Cronartium quercuum f. sp. fusiforme G11 TaxID=708437 RepID=A0A9P6NVX0_9BASI|nr:hypothetical protein CROQUDRAFT_651185 [Cronartium quercuum f. sp. fusiforme G11]
MDNSNHTLVDAHLSEYFISEIISLLCTSATHSLKTSIESRNQHQITPNPKIINEPNQMDIDEAYRIRMDKIGYRVGYVLAERLVKDKSRIPKISQSSSPDPLEVIKFICKDLWSAMYNKQADNLRTNHRGVFVLQDYGFRPFLRLSSTIGYENELDQFCQKMLIFPLAVIRGALMNLGIQSVVSAEIAVPQCTFQIRTAIGPAPVTPSTAAKS